MKSTLKAILILAVVAVTFVAGVMFGRIFDFYSTVYELPPGRNTVASLKRLLNLQPSYSQFQQDLWVALTLGQHGKSGGYYVDVGSADGVLISNTYLLDQMAWKGVCIDPFPRHMQNRTCQVFKQPVYSESGKKVQFRSAVNLGGIESDLGSNKKELSKAPLVELVTATLDEILDKAKAPNWIDYMNIDVEGAEYDVLRGFSFNRYQVGTLTIEHNYEAEKRERIRKLMQENGYVRVRSWEVDDWYVNRELAKNYHSYITYSTRELIF
jgi:FkbM family methyltransferase